MHPNDNKICATVLFLPSEYECGDTCDLHVVHHAIPPAQIATMHRDQLDEIKNKILDRHPEAIAITQDTKGHKAIVTLTYEPSHFTAHERPLHDFVIWVESLCNRARADYRKSVIRANTYC